MGYNISIHVPQILFQEEMNLNGDMALQNNGQKWENQRGPLDPTDFLFL